MDELSAGAAHPLPVDVVQVHQRRGRRYRALRHDGQRVRVPRPRQQYQGRRRMRRLLHAGLRIVGEGIRLELQPARAQVAPQGDRLRQVHSRGDVSAIACHQLDPPKEFTQTPWEFRICQFCLPSCGSERTLRHSGDRTRKIRRATRPLGRTLRTNLATSSQYDRFTT